MTLKEQEFIFVKCIPIRRFLIISGFLQVISVGGFAQGQIKTEIIVSPARITAQPHQTTAIGVTVKDIADLFASSLTIKFDTTILHFSGIMRGPFLTKNNENSVFFGFAAAPPPPAASSSITVDEAICSGRTVNGSGVLFTLLFTAVQTGTSPISIVSMELRDGSNNAIPAHIESGKFIVNNVPQAVQLLSPPQGSTIDTTAGVILLWSKSIDRDTGDTVRYTLHFSSASSSMCVNNITDTSFILTKDVLFGNTEFTWYIDATDGLDTASSEQIFKFRTPLALRNAIDSEKFKLHQNYPNPFSQSTSIRFTCPEETRTEITIIDITGRQVIRLLSVGGNAGNHLTRWDGKNGNGIDVGSGTYFCVVKAGPYRDVKKMVYVK